VIAQGVDPGLDNMKNTYEGLNDLLKQAAEQLAETVPANIRFAFNAIYFPQIGFLLAVPLHPVTGDPGYDAGVESGWERMFSTEHVVPLSLHIP
jgi:DNA mismatch repair protein MSH5